MRFQIIMNMGSFNGNSVHQIICEHPAKSLDDFVEYLDGRDFVTVEEWYRDHNTKDLYRVGDVSLNCALIGKIKLFK